MKLKNKFKINGKTTINDNCFCQAMMKTLPKETKIKTYSTDHTGPNRYDGGDQEGLINCEYQLYVCIDSLYQNDTKTIPRRSHYNYSPIRAN